MNYVAYYPNGQIQQSGTCQDGSLQYQGAPGTIKMEVPDAIDPNAFYVSDGTLVPLPPRPSQHHDFNYVTKQWVVDTERAWAAVRYQRDKLLTATDWRVTRAQESGQAVAPQWAAYRQALRDITQQADPVNIVWPTVPT